MSRLRRSGRLFSDFARDVLVVALLSIAAGLALVALFYLS